jgi:hypothetical protein
MVADTQNAKQAIRIAAALGLAAVSLALMIVLGAIGFRSATRDIALNKPGLNPAVCVADDQCYRVRRRPKPTV